MRATILAPGSRGDVQPYVALGQALRALGHDCALVTTLDHEALVRSHGLEVATIPVSVAAELARVEATRAVEGGGVLSSFRQFTAIARRSARAVAEVGLEACRGADVLVTNFSTALVADGLSKKLGVPVVQAYNVPTTPTSAFPGALFPGLDFGGLSRRLGHRLTRAALWATARASANEACVEVLRASPAPLLPRPYAGLLPGGVLYGFSEAFLPRPSDGASELEVTGFWFVDEPADLTPDPALERFLDEGPPPVCVGFGSMSTERPDEVGALVLEAARMAGVRLVLLSGWAGLEPISSDVLTIPSAPHSWLYPRCRAVAHHGGAGTTAAAVRAGVPAVVTPFHGDQPFWASRVHALGLGPRPIPRKKLTAKRLADALSRVTRLTRGRADVAPTRRSVGAHVLERRSRGARGAARHTTPPRTTPIMAVVMPAAGFSLFDTAIGPCGVAWGPGGLTGLQLPEGSAQATRARLAARFPEAVLAPPPSSVAQAVEAVVALLAGRGGDLSAIALDLTGVSPFRARVYALARAIPVGETTTYGVLAARAGSPGSARAVGQAMGKNPFPIVVPCHRVLAANGKPGGFSAAGGVAIKLRMLAIEGAPGRAAARGAG